MRRRQITLAAVGFTLTLLLLMAAAWPIAPFPQLSGIAALMIAGLAFGALFRQWWAVWLVLCLLPAGMVADHGVLGGVATFFVGAPAAGLGLAGGVAWTRMRRAPSRQARGAAGNRRSPGARRRRRRPVARAAPSS